ncbi:MAG: ROK family protein [Deltaproteobacteria bacterium]|nr:ROK family protein [Deltaproteobacteria bacterium]
MNSSVLHLDFPDHLIMRMDYALFSQVNIRDELKKILDFDKSILFCNDAEAAVIGEANYGAGKDFGRVIGITLGTGLGAAFIVNGVSVHDGQGIPSNAELFPFKFNGKRADDLFSTRGLIERFYKRGFSLISVFQKFGEDLGLFLRPFVDDFGADVLLVLGGISGAIEYFHREVEDQLNIPVFPGRSQNAALLGAADLLLT